MNKIEFVTELAALRTGSTFLTLHKYENAKGEVADHLIVFHMSYENALKKSLELARAHVAVSELEKQARNEVIASYEKSLKKMAETPVEEIDDQYQRFIDTDGSYIKGVKVHRDTSELYVYGKAHLKRIITPGIYKKVNSRPLTIAKREIQKLCPASKFRQYKVNPSQLEKIRVENLTLLPPEGDDFGDEE